MADYSTLEVTHEHENYPEVVHNQQYEGGIPAHGYYDPSKYGYPSPQPTTVYSSPSIAHAGYSDYNHNHAPEVVPQNYPEVVESKEGNHGQNSSAAGATICGIRRKTFWIVLAVALIVVIALAVGVGVGVTESQSSDKDKSSGSSSGSSSGNGNGNGSGSGNGNGGSPDSDNSTTSTLTLLDNTQLSSANFTDTFGYENYLVVYQLSDLTITMSAYNSSNKQWITSPIVNGSTNSVANGTSLSISTTWTSDTTSPSIQLFYLEKSDNVMGLWYDTTFNISTTSVVPVENWESLGLSDAFSASDGFALASYGKQCANCNQYNYVFWQESDGLYVCDNVGGFIDPGVVIDNTDPADNTSLAMSFSGTFTDDSDAILRRSLNLFFRASGGALTQLRMGNGQNTTFDTGRSIGANTNMAVFSTGWNESDPSTNPTPLTLQVLTIDPDANNAVQLTYLTESTWTPVADEVTNLADCAPKAMMAANSGQRLYCLQSADSGIEIMEYSWGGNLTDTITFLSWEQIGTVNITTST
ncbi:hypothetical protein F5Y16DRAFT_46864 [Xylariaceae sp. FL0255]|nr:hypothetical protein F5Y16DRAFT_46864 [Xylariaceae sp. FL0255]